jgi:molybdopterin/thiamine biosynthesis adenylyltransferase
LLATSGVGRLGIIDNDTLSRDNVHRHVLGMESVGKKKAEALAIRLGEQFPHQHFWFGSTDCIDVLSEAAFDPSTFNVIILATGNETLELRINAALRRQTHLVHVWLDPFDLGYHVFVDGKNKRGCFRCLFARDDAVGLHNRASFLEKDQTVTGSLAGCAGNFAQYSVQHALSAATAAVELVLSSDLADGPFLLSKYCSDAAAKRLGFLTSRRCQMFEESRLQRTASFGHGACEGCMA